MEVRATAKHIKIGPLKTRLVIDLVRGLKVERAIDQLQFLNKWAAKPVLKLVNSAVANAVNNFELDKDNLFIKEIKVDEGPKMKRWMPKAFGRATPFLKRTSHITLVLGELKDSGIKTGKKIKADEPMKLGAHPKGEGSVKLDDKATKENKETDEKGKKSDVIHGAEGRHGHAKTEGGHKKGFTGKLFQRKSG